LEEELGKKVGRKKGALWKGLWPIAFGEKKGRGVDGVGRFTPVCWEGPNLENYEQQAKKLMFTAEKGKKGGRTCLTRGF